MSNFSKKNKTGGTQLDEYVNIIRNKSELLIPNLNKLAKINNTIISIPTIKNYTEFIRYNYNIPQLKTIATHYTLKVGGTKSQLVNRIFSFLYLSFNLIKIQKIFRGKIQRTYNQLHGPAYVNRKLCTNKNDFVTMEPLEEINFNQFISFQDLDGFIYGFDIVSINNFLGKSGNKIKNPYNRALIPESVVDNIKTLLRLSKILKRDICLQNDEPVFSLEKTIEMRALMLFQNMDLLGNYSNSQWFLSLTKIQIIKYVRELSDIWNYRAQLSMEVKLNICPPIGDPFRNLSISYLHTETNMSNVRKVVLEVLEKMVNSGVDADSKSLGAYYVLGGLTLVSENAATALPWLYQSVSYF
jgi:hypothetical protein